MKNIGIFITLEGTDGVGKTTHAKKLALWLQKRGRHVVLTREPGGGQVAEKIRELLLNPKVKMENLTELFLYEAARIEHLHRIVLPALKKRKIVICDRFTDATVAYQGFARGLKKEVPLLNKVATQGIQPNLTLFLDLPPRLGIKKARARRGSNSKGDRMEKEGILFQEKVRKGYLYLLKKYPRRIKHIEVRENIEETQEALRKEVLKHLT